MIHGLVRRRLLVIASALAPAVLLGGLALVVPGPSLLWNRSESEPRGLYIRSAAAPSRGQIIAFPAPSSVLTYASGRMAYLRHMPILKEVAAMSGDTVCTLDGKLVINGVEANVEWEPGEVWEKVDGLALEVGYSYTGSKVLADIYQGNRVPW